MDSGVRPIADDVWELENGTEVMHYLYLTWVYDDLRRVLGLILTAHTKY